MPMLVNICLSYSSGMVATQGRRQQDIEVTTVKALRTLGGTCMAEHQAFGPKLPGDQLHGLNRAVSCSRPGPQPSKPGLDFVTGTIVTRVV